MLRGSNMEAIRKFLIRYNKQILGGVAVLILVLCIGLTAVYRHSVGELIGIFLLALSVILLRKEEAVAQTISYLLLGAAVFFFPASAAVVLFYAGEVFRIHTGRW